MILLLDKLRSKDSIKGFFALAKRCIEKSIMFDLNRNINRLKLKKIFKRKNGTTAVISSL